jgi:hypothetical protein
MTMKLFCNDGIGNQLQKFPVWLALGSPRIKYKIKRNGQPAKTELFDELCNRVGFNNIESPFTFADRNRDGNEFRNNCACFGFSDKEVCEEFLPFKWKTTLKKKYDIVLCNGGFDDFQWQRKKYQRWNEVIKVLVDQGYSVASIGTPCQYVYPAVDMTHLSILESVDLIQNCKLFMSNDTGLYHMANLIGKQNIVVFTATSIEKNYNEYFHAYSYLLHPNLGCSCQDPRPGTGPRWDRCKHFRCWEFPPQIIIDTALEALNGPE